MPSNAESRLIVSETGTDVNILPHAEPTRVPAEPVSGNALILAVEDLYNRLNSITLQTEPFLASYC